MNYQPKNLNIFDELAKIENMNISLHSDQETSNNPSESTNTQDWSNLLHWENNSEEESQD